MKNLTNNFSSSYQPVKALLIYNKQTGEAEHNTIYVESYDIGKFGNPINAHPLSLKETLALSGLFQTAQELKTGFLRCRGLMPNKVLYVNNEKGGYAVWYTPPQEVTLFFSDSLGIKSGNGKVPAMIWRAGRESLAVYALKGNRKPTEKTALYHAPFFNIYHDGKVCMGNVRIDIGQETRLEDFMQQWEKYYWNSYFSHLMNDHNPVTENIVQLWQTQINTERTFPCQVLKPTNYTLKNLFL
ncbi:PRTRC system protein B [Mucilaginibacter sabulilitoris]|uniref:PRTRC system protein B n=1 Tax=Mucilaginibacter sabulilitoris TaxID=1173583 RepID=A0ABZ0TNG3_9SPHI|nr:PRTRC system protein B [Mucilaginibacter sabulilitoris]WPU94695.1 PRTRC system protein B [Mucilaginibacter sabulilitoris]